MNIDSAKAFVAQNKWWIAAVLVVAGGYTVGKDLAFRDNARDAIETSAGTQN